MNDEFGKQWSWPIPRLYWHLNERTEEILKQEKQFSREDLIQARLDNEPTVL
jgi:hypothetical protein